MGGAACNGFFGVNLHLCKTICTSAGPFGATSGTKTQRRPLTKFGSRVVTPLKIGPFYIFLVFLLHIFFHFLAVVCISLWECYCLG